MYIEAANGVMESKPIEITLDENENEAENFANTTSNNIALLEKCNDNWSNILNELKDGAKVTKESEYAHVDMWGQRWAYSSVID